MLITLTVTNPNPKDSDVSSDATLMRSYAALRSRPIRSGEENNR